MQKRQSSFKFVITTFYNIKMKYSVKENQTYYDAVKN